ncbi:MAG: hypothetical protein WA952_03130 [Lewinella sp.]
MATAFELQVWRGTTGDQEIEPDDAGTNIYSSDRLTVGVCVV